MAGSRAYLVAKCCRPVITGRHSPPLTATQIRSDANSGLGPPRPRIDGRPALDSPRVRPRFSVACEHQEFFQEQTLSARRKVLSRNLSRLLPSNKYRATTAQATAARTRERACVGTAARAVVASRVSAARQSISRCSRPPQWGPAPGEAAESCGRGRRRGPCCCTGAQSGPGTAGPALLCDHTDAMMRGRGRERSEGAPLIRKSVATFHGICRERGALSEKTNYLATRNSHRGAHTHMSTAHSRTSCGGVGA